MSNLERRVGNLERVSNPPSAPRVLWIWDGSPIPPEAEAGNCVVHIIRWLRPDEAPADARNQGERQ